jgi:YD repeat-containing protein
MLQRRIIALCTGLLVFITVHAQVNLQTGSATFSLPMFNWQDDKSRLKLDVALSYNSGNGLRVNDVASNVGQGWNMVAGGVITRMQVGEPDDQKAYDGNGKETDITKYPNGYLYSFASSGKKPGDGCPLALTRYPIYGSMNQVYKQHNTIAADKQLDYFSFQFNGKAGMFVLDPNRGNVGVFLGDTKMQVSFDLADLTPYGIRTTIKAFTITDVDGLIYRFENYGTMKVLEENYCDANLVQARTQPKLDVGKSYHQAGFENATYKNPLVINSWYLTKITDPFTGRIISFTYNTRQVNNIAGVDVSYDSWHDYSIITHKKSITTALEIASITLPDQHVVTFNYGKDRIDLTGQKILSNVDIQYQGRYLSRYLLHTSYFILNRYGTPTSSYEMAAARLCLLSVKKLGPDLKEDSPPYIFNYYMGTGGDDVVPPPFCIKHDIWGFYNGSNSKDFDGNDNIPVVGGLNLLNNSQCKGLCFLQNNVSGITYGVKDHYAKNGLLRQIIYPTGGSITYEYEQNKGDLPNASNISIGGVHVSKTSSADGGYSNGCDNAITTRYNYILDNTGASSMWGLEAPVNADTGWMHYASEYRTYRWTIHNFPFGSCFWHFQYPGILSQNQSVDLSSFQKTMAAIAPVLDVISAISTITDVVTLVCSSSGFLSWAAVVVDVISGLITLGINCFGDNSKEGTTVTYHDFDLNAASPLPTQFKRVEVVEGSGTRGKTIHKFTSDEEFPIWYPSNPNYAAMQRFGPWAYGLPRFTTVLDVNGNKVRETQNDYNFPYNMLDPIYKSFPLNGVFSKLVSCKCLVKKSWSQRNTDWADPNKYNDSATYRFNSTDTMGVETYPLYSGRAELATTYERVYKPNDPSNYVETRTDYSYNDGNNNYDVNQISTTQSNGSYTTRFITYNSDLSGGVLDVLKAKNVTSLPVMTEEYLNGVNGGYLNQTVTEFIQLSNGDVKPLRVLNERTDRPTKTWTHYNGPSNTDYSKYHVTELFTYDAAGNLVGAKDEGGRTVANIYDYQDKYVVASVINADAVNDKPAYTSFETDNLGGWQLSGTPNQLPATAITGVRVSNLAGSSLSASLNTNKPYIVSFWANSSNVTVTGNATLVKSAPVINGYTYYEYNITAGTGTVTISGNAYIDELRLYPQMSRMRTVAYDPLIGKTAECDENNRLTYYEYDNLGRLRFVKDDYSNIVKMFEYNNVSKQNGCPGVYTNQMLTVTFTKACDPGYIGTDKPYTVPAGKYSSAISQEDADAQAEMDLLTNGQNNADQNGQCNQLYYNIAHVQSFQTQSCGDGYEGDSVMYTVPANKYSSIVPGEADQMAMDEIAANGQAYANSPDHASCHIDANPIWEVGDLAVTQCQQVNGNGHLFELAKDVNPNSSSYGKTSWQDTGPNSSCPSGPWPSEDMSGTYYNTNCAPGYSSYPTYVSMPAGSFVSNISQQDANNQATAQAQAIANTRDLCEGGPVYVYAAGIYPSDPNVQVVYQSIASGEIYTFQGDGYGIPAGNYYIYLSGLNSSNYDLNVCGLVQHGSQSPWITMGVNENCYTYSVYPLSN